MSAATNEKPKDKWDLYAGVLVERLPVVSKTPNKIEQEYSVKRNRRWFTYRSIVNNFLLIV